MSTLALSKVPVTFTSQFDLVMREVIRFVYNNYTFTQFHWSTLTENTNVREAIRKYIPYGNDDGVK